MEIISLINGTDFSIIHFHLESDINSNVMKIKPHHLIVKGMLR